MADVKRDLLTAVRCSLLKQEGEVEEEQRLQLRLRLLFRCLPEGEEGQWLQLRLLQQQHHHHHPLFLLRWFECHVHVEDEVVVFVVVPVLEARASVLGEQSSRVKRGVVVKSAWIAPLVEVHEVLRGKSRRPVRGVS